MNKEKKALGFFNPSDLFARCNDINSNSYNPYSNEMDVIYVAVPSNDGIGPYGIKSLTATVAHELTHLITFSNKTMTPLIQGDENAKQEEVFLDEGWSHLSESLCGFGLSGGNLDFLAFYLESPGNYSFCKENIYGQIDSAGMRGAITLFLYWLFEQAGGMSWDLDNPKKLIDLGGISFLQEMISLPTHGWTSIGEAYGKSVSSLFSQFAIEFNKISNTKENNKIIFDPLTLEPISVCACMGFIAVGDDSIFIGAPKKERFTQETFILPWSIQFGLDSICQSLTPFSLVCDTKGGNVYFSLLKID